MRQVFLDKGNVVVKEASQPFLDDYSVLVSIHYSYISSGTEIATISNAKSGLFSNVPHKVKKVLESVAAHGVEGTAALIKGKLKGDIFSLGYSCAGRVIGIGKKVRTIRPGDWVACAGAGYAHHADLVCVPENLVVQTHREHLKAASLTTIGAIALQGVRRAQVQLGDRVAVVGLGLLGQITVQLLKAAGCYVIGTDLMPERLSLAMRCAADAVFNPTHDDLIKEVNLLTEHHGADVAIITAASKSNAIIQQAMEITRKKGRVIIVGDIGLSLNREPFYQKEIDLLMSCSYGPGRYDAEYEQKGHDYPYAYVRWTEKRNMQAFVSLIEQGTLSCDELITDEVSLDNIQWAYERIQSKEKLGVVLRYDRRDDEYHEQTRYVASRFDNKSETSAHLEIRFIPAKKDTIRVGVVGAGGFAKIKLMPLISKMRNVKINAIVDVDVANSMSVSRVYGAAKACSDDYELFNDDIVDAVIISSPHKFHCAQALRALTNGKAVFLEKPMVTDFEQLQQLNAFLKQHSTAPFCVDYNRSFSPFMQKIKKVISKRKAPLIAYYRMNAGYIAKEHWIQSDIGAGRIIGEACHIFDLFCFLTDARPVAVSVEALHAARNDIFPTDNFCVQISFDDGSVCSLLYTALGNKELSKERMELFYDKKAIVMEDYTELYGFGLPSWFNETVAMPNKGHEALLKRFFQELRKDQFTPPIDFQRLQTVAQLTLVIDQLACEGGGTKDMVS